MDPVVQMGDAAFPFGTLVRSSSMWLAGRVAEESLSLAERDGHHVQLESIENPGRQCQLSDRRRLLRVRRRWVVGTAMDFLGSGVSRGGRVVDDRLVGHEQSDDVSQLAWMTEVDGVSGTFDHDEQRMAVGPAGHVLNPGWGRHQRIAVPEHG